jgi:hypothetical protein
MRALLAQILGADRANYSAGRMAYDLRRLRPHGIIERIPRSHCYQFTAEGLRIALFFYQTDTRLLQPQLAELLPGTPAASSAIPVAFDLQSTPSQWIRSFPLKLDQCELQFFRQGF